VTKAPARSLRKDGILNDEEGADSAPSWLMEKAVVPHSMLFLPLLPSRYPLIQGTVTVDFEKRHAVAIFLSFSDLSLQLTAENGPTTRAPR